MPYGEIFISTFKTIWRHKRLWLFGLLGTLLVSLGGGIQQAMAMSWQRQWLGPLKPFPGPEGPPGGSPLTAMAGLWTGLGILCLAGVIGYVINLVMRGATISEAAIAWRGEPTKTRRGLNVGLNRGVYLFLIDLLWAVPGAILIGGPYVLGLVVILATEGPADSEAGMPALLSVCGLMCCVSLIALVYGVFKGIFAPLMYQSAVRRQHHLGAAIKEGWNLARANLGSMFVFWLLVFAMMMGLNLVVFAISSALMWPAMMRWMGPWPDIMQELMPAADLTLSPPGPGSAARLYLAACVQTVLGWLTSSFMQTFSLTLYAEVYRRSSGEAAPASALDPLAPPAPSMGEAAVPEEPAESGS